MTAKNHGSKFPPIRIDLGIDSSEGEHMDESFHRTIVHLTLTADNQITTKNSSND